jgi:serine/threonine protein kinase
MNERDPPIRGSPPRVLLERVIVVCDRYELAWRTGQQPTVADYLPDVSEPDRTAFLRELIALDLRLRRERGEGPTQQEYCGAFPERSELIESVFQSLSAETRPDETGPTLPSNRSGPDAITVEGPRVRGSGPVEALRTIGKYVVLNRIDGGGQGSVYRVLHPLLQGEFVLKLAHRRLDTDAPERASLINEGRTLVRLDHPGLARVIDLDLDGDRPFLVLEYVRGRTLEQYAAEAQPTPEQAARLVAELARTVAYLHAQGVVHQDIKPRNIVLDGAGRPRLIDFGLARLRQTWSDGWDVPTGGTPQFMAPEQAQARQESDAIGPACDVFALGGVLYFLLTGQTPFRGQTRQETLAAAAHCAFDRAALGAREVPPRLARIVLRAMAAAPADRHPDAASLARDLDRYVQGHRRARLVVALIAVTVPLMGLLLGLLGRDRDRNGDRDRTAPATPRIEALEIRHYRDDPVQGPLLIGLIGADSQHCWFDDAVRVRARLSAPAYGYLIALHPNGQTQLYYPENETTPPRRFLELSYPAGAELYSPLTDGTGLQAFALVVTEQPLPPYREWIDRGGALPWRPAGSDAEGVWRYDGRSFERLDPGQRSNPRRLAAPAPPFFVEACRSLATRPEVRSIQAWAFPVRPKATPATATPLG